MLETPLKPKINACKCGSCTHELSYANSSTLPFNRTTVLVQGSVPGLLWVAFTDSLTDGADIALMLSSYQPCKDSLKTNRKYFHFQLNCSGVIKMIKERQTFNPSDLRIEWVITFLAECQWYWITAQSLEQANCENDDQCPPVSAAKVTENQENKVQVRLKRVCSKEMWKNRFVHLPGDNSSLEKMMKRDFF